MSGTLAAGLLLLQTDPFRLVGDLLSSPYVRAGFYVSVAYLVVFWLATVYWVYTDAERRGAAGWVWGMLAVVIPLGGAAIYLVVRPREYLVEREEREETAREQRVLLANLENDLKKKVDLCPGCRAQVEPEYLCCPECGRNLKRECEGCTQPLKKDWSYCPHCKTEQLENRIRR